MIAMNTARQLKTAGLTWIPQLHDFFAIPDRNMDDRVFVISDMLVTVEFLRGLQVVSFQGASEWALDSLVTTEAIWMPTEAQLRQSLEAALMATDEPRIRLFLGLNKARCEFYFQDQLMAFEASHACDAYADALLHVLRKQSQAASLNDQQQ